MVVTSFTSQIRELESASEEHLRGNVKGRRESWGVQIERQQIADTNYS